MDASEDVVGGPHRGTSDYVTKPLDFAIVMATGSDPACPSPFGPAGKSAGTRDLQNETLGLESANRLLVCRGGSGNNQTRTSGGGPGTEGVASRIAPRPSLVLRVCGWVLQAMPGDWPGTKL